MKPCGHCSNGVVSGIPCTRCAGKGTVPDALLPCPCPWCRERTPVPPAPAPPPLCECGDRLEDHSTSRGACVYCSCRVFAPAVEA